MVHEACRTFHVPAQIQGRRGPSLGGSHGISMYPPEYRRRGEGVEYAGFLPTNSRTSRCHYCTRQAGPLDVMAKSPSLLLENVCSFYLPLIGKSLALLQLRWIMNDNNVAAHTRSRGTEIYKYSTGWIEAAQPIVIWSWRDFSA